MGWTESYRGGSAEAENAAFHRLAEDIHRAQEKARRAADSATIERAFHAKPLLATDDAELRFRSDLPGDLTSGFAQPGAQYRVRVRISNAANRRRPDSEKDMRGIALRVYLSNAEQHDFLGTNYPVSHARDARQFVRFALATAGGTLSRLLGIAELFFSEGPAETLRMLHNVSKARRRTDSAALETYWSRGAMRWGPSLALRFLLRPIAAAPPSGRFDTDPDGLSKELAARLAASPVRFELAIQRYANERTTPIEDTSIAWEPSAAPIEPVATLTIAQQDMTTAAAREKSRIINASAFNPWNTTDEFRPLGNLNRARKSVYAASAALRGSYG
jgi:Catalase